MTQRGPRICLVLQVAELLNSNPIGGKRRSAYHYDLWCIKYLPKFKWDHLTEEVGETTYTMMESHCLAILCPFPQPLLDLLLHTTGNKKPPSLDQCTRATGLTMHRCFCQAFYPPPESRNLVRFLGRTHC